MIEYRHLPEARSARNDRITRPRQPGPPPAHHIVPVGLAGAGDDRKAIGADEIARTLAAMDAVEPFEMTEEERAAIEADCWARQEWDLSRFPGHADRQRDAWE